MRGSIKLPQVMVPAQNKAITVKISFVDFERDKFSVEALNQNKYIGSRPPKIKSKIKISKTKCIFCYKVKSLKYHSVLMRRSYFRLSTFLVGLGGIEPPTPTL